MFELLKKMLAGRNDFASGGLLLMVIGALGVYLRAVPEALWWWLVRQTTMVVTVTDDDAAFVWVKEWFLEQKFLRRIRHVDLDTTLRAERISMIPTPGKHWFWHRGRPFEVWFHRTENSEQRYTRRFESLTFRTVGRKRAVLERFVDDVVRSHTRTQVNLYWYNDGWERVQGYTPRLLDSVVLESGEEDRLVQDVAQFRSARLKYQRLGIPYHRGYLFYGPPGTGKTSLVSALGAHFAMSIYSINLTEFNDRTLMTAINQVPRDSIVLFEDIDCMNGGQPRTETGNRGGETASGGSRAGAAQNGVTLSGLLNVLDGFLAPTGVLFVITTNHFSKLDEALLRPGRIDYRLHLGQASSQQKMKLYRRFFPEADEAEACEFVERTAFTTTMAEFQGLLLAVESGGGKPREERRGVTLPDESVKVR
ncbi:MAG TPA: AAA family ATPase [Candidatus Acidoferrales bacterium]|nr:AAA family ATPase [Candidatus Acidoferrales bacterium]